MDLKVVERFDGTGPTNEGCVEWAGFRPVPHFCGDDLRGRWLGHGRAMCADIMYCQ